MFLSAGYGLLFLSLVTTPVIRAKLSKLVSKSEQGEYQGQSVPSHLEFISSDLVFPICKVGVMIPVLPALLGS